MDQNSAILNFSQILILLTEKINREKNSFEKFKLLSTFNYVVRNNTLFKFCQNENYIEAMSYLEKLSPHVPVPRYISILSKCGITVTESPTSVVLIPKNKGITFKVENDLIGSGKDAVQVAAVQFASDKDKTPYLVDFNVEERKRKLEEHSEGKVKYEDYLSSVSGEVSNRQYREVEVLNGEGEIIIEPQFDAYILGIHHPDTALEIFEKFKGSVYGFRIKILKNKILDFVTPGFKLENIDNVYTFTPISDFGYVKGPEDDKLIENIIGYLESNSVVKKGERLGASDYDHRNAYKEVCKIESADYTPEVAIRSKDDVRVEKRLLQGVSEDIIRKFRKIKFDFEEHRDNIQVNRDKYMELLDKNFKAPNNLRRRITGMKSCLKGLSFAGMVEQGTNIVESCTNTQSYKQSVSARYSLSYAGKDRQVYLSLFLDVLIRSPAQFPKMALGDDGIFRFVLGNRDYKVDRELDPYELRKLQSKLDLTNLGGEKYEGIREVDWPSRDVLSQEEINLRWAAYDPCKGVCEEKEFDETENI